jgi:hypothetical protein
MTMRLLPVLLSATLSLVGCGQREPKPMPPNPPAILHLDSAHNHAAGTNAEFYVIEACQSAEVDTTGYSIPVPPKLQISGPNAIHLIHANDEYFRAGWDGKSRVVLDAGSLKNIKGSGGFSGFRDGEEYVLGIGHDNYPEPKMQFRVLWAGMIKVNSMAQPGGSANRSQPVGPGTNRTPPAAGSGG